MIRFRIGQSWKREREAAPVDSFGLEIEGVDLLAGASEEPLAKVVPELLDAVHALAIEGKRYAQVSLGEAHLELVLLRQDLQVELRVVSLGRPARLVRAPLKVDLAELSAAAVRCGRGLVRDLSGAAPALLREARQKKMVERLGALERCTLREAPAPGPGPAKRLVHLPSERPAFGFELEDRDNLLLEYHSRSAWPLPSLLGEGRVFLRLAGDEEVWQALGPPFLLCLELSRQAAELARAIEAQDEAVSLDPAGRPPSLLLRPGEGRAGVGGRRLTLAASALARAMFELGLGFVWAAASRNKAQAKNPYLAELTERCREGITHLRGAVGPAAGKERQSTSGHRRKGFTAAKPLRSGGRLRRLRFEPLWEKHRLGGGGPGRLLSGKRGPIFSSIEMACAFGRDGELLYRQVATHGVAASPEGWVLTASASWVTGFFGPGPSARWFRSHDGVSIGPELHRKDGILVAGSAGRGVVAFAEATGRELWRVVPPRTQRAHLSVQGHRALLATDAGYLYGIDLDDGQVRFRVQAPLPFSAAPVPWGKRLLALLSRGERSMLFAADAHQGKVSWQHEAALASPSRPMAIGGRAFLAGRREGGPVLLCIGSKGQLLWERKLPLGAGALFLLALGRDVLAADASGGAALIGGEGQIEWRLGAAGEELPCAIAPCLARRVLILPGEKVRAVDPRGGQVLAEVKAGAGLCDLEVDGKLNLFLLDEAGSLKAYRLTSHFTVV